jgi:hypothetical protein
MMNAPTLAPPFAVRIAAALLLSAGCHGAHASGNCDGDSAHFRILPRELGKPGQTVPTPYALPCDSMVVPAGQTTRILGATMIHFGADPSASGKITVKGELIVEGKPGNPVYLSGSVASTEFGFVPGPHSWGGLEVDSGASLRMNHVRMFNAPTALVLFSKNAILQDCYFRGVSGVVLPDTSLFLDPQGQTVATLDLRNGKAPGLAKAPAAPRGGGSRSSAKHTALIAAGGAGIAALLLGAGWLALNATDDGGTPASPPAMRFDDPPPLPEIPKPAGE